MAPTTVPANTPSDQPTRRDLSTLIESAQCQIEDAHHQLYAVRELARALRVSLEGLVEDEYRIPREHSTTIEHLAKLALERVLLAEDDLSEAGTRA